MADKLTAKTCTPCKGGVPPLTQQEAQGFHREVPAWEMQDDAHRIERKLSSKTSARRCGL
jgi:4a-hydroxytetrahydrobiopterin dehydratase